jgi:hypothetical protein
MHPPDLVAGRDRGPRRHIDAADLHDIGKGYQVPRRGDNARAAEEDQGRAKVDDKESEHAEDAGRVNGAYKPSGSAPAAFDGIRDIGIEPVDHDIHETGSRTVAANSARRTRGGTKSSWRDVAKRISDE